MLRRSLLAFLVLGACAQDDPAVVAGGPERLETGARQDADRSGDLRPAAARVLDALADPARGAVTLGDLRRRGLLPAAPRARTPYDFTAPASIRVWRRRVDGSTDSCTGRVDVIPFEDYVAGVLPHEWIASWEPEALRGGAVAIRSYAAWWVAAGGKYDCADLDDTTASQVYDDDRNPRTDDAVATTAGWYVVRDDSLVMAEYSAENSDPTADGVSEPHCTGQEVFGHGRGTCQWGTQRWAQIDGKTWDWMMEHYYPGAIVVGPGPGGGGGLHPGLTTPEGARGDVVGGGAGDDDPGEDPGSPNVLGCALSPRACGGAVGWRGAALVAAAILLARRRRRR